MITVHMQPLLQFNELLLSRTRVWWLTLRDSTSRSNAHGSYCSIEDSRLVPIATLACFPDGATPVAELSFTATPLNHVSSCRTQDKFGTLHHMMASEVERHHVATLKTCLPPFFFGHYK